MTIPIESKIYKPQYSAIPLLGIFNMENPSQVHNESRARRIILAHLRSEKLEKDTIVH